MPVKLNDKAIKVVKAAVKHREIAVTGCPNLVLNVYAASPRHPSGTKTFTYRYRVGDQIRRVKIGPYPAMSLHEVREHYLEHERVRARGGDPIEEARKQQASLAEVTCAEFAEVYMAHWSIPRKRTHAEDRRMLDKDVIPSFGTIRMGDVTTADVVAVIDRIVKRGAGISANRTFALMRRFFRFAIERGVLEHSPCTHVRAPAKENRRERVLSPEEISAFMSALEQSNMSTVVNAALRFLLVSCQRLGEVASMEWEHVDLVSRIWSLPAERSKNGQSHRIPLSAGAVLILRRLEPNGSPTGWVFPGVDEHHIRPGSISQALTRLVGWFELNHFTAHDLRRTAATQMSGMGVNRLIIARILNHTDRSITAVYDRYSYEREVREALEEWSSKLDEIFAGETRVTAIRSQKDK